MFGKRESGGDCVYLVCFDSDFDGVVHDSLYGYHYLHFFVLLLRLQWWVSVKRSLLYYS